MQDISDTKQGRSGREKLLDALQEEEDTLSAVISGIERRRLVIDTHKKLTLLNSAASTFALDCGKKIDVEELAKRVEVR